LKSEMTSFDVAALVYELNQTIKDARIENIYQINRRTLMLGLHKPNQAPMQMLIEAGKRVHLTTYVQEKPFKPPDFCMLLRKYLRNGRIQDFQQQEFERTISFKISTREGLFRLVAELFGEGNIILVDQHGFIISALNYKRMRDRNILRNEPFKQAPSSGKNPFHTTCLQIDHLKTFDQLEIVRALTKFLSIGGLYAEELLLRAGIDKNTLSKDVTEQQLDALFTQLKALLSHITEGKLNPTIILNPKDEWCDVTPIRLKKYETWQAKAYKTFNEALDEYYTQASLLSSVSTAQKEYERELAKQQRMLQDQQTTIEESRKTIEHNRRVGDLIYTHLGELQQLTQQVLNEKQNGKSWEQIADSLKEEKRFRSPAVYFSSFDSKHMILNLSIEGNSFPIRIDRSVQANAAEYYEKMKKAERKLKGSETALRETQHRIQELQQLWTRKIEEVKEKEPKKRADKAWYEKFRWFYSSDGFLVVGGKDATTNEILIKKHTEPQDIIFHADIVGAPFVVIKTQGKVASEQTLQEAAQFAASYSRAWREMLSTTDVYWVRPSQVSKTPPHGQFLEKGSFIIKGAKNYSRSVPLLAGIGIQIKNEHFELVAGPAKMVSKHTDIYVEIAPGKQSGRNLAKQIRALFIKNAPRNWRERILSIPNEEFMVFVPFGIGEVTLK